ncbi:MAG: putative quinol monooxygenase [Sphingopyxis sp.]
MTELFIFGRFHVKPEHVDRAAALLRQQVQATRKEPGCCEIQVFCAIRDPQLFLLHSRWNSVAAFDLHAELPRTQRFIELICSWSDFPPDVTRTHVIDTD